MKAAEEKQAADEEAAAAAAAAAEEAAVREAAAAREAEAAAEVEVAKMAANRPLPSASPVPTPQPAAGLSSSPPTGQPAPLAMGGRVSTPSPAGSSRSASALGGDMHGSPTTIQADRSESTGDTMPAATVLLSSLAKTKAEAEAVAAVAPAQSVQAVQQPAVLPEGRGAAASSPMLPVFSFSLSSAALYGEDSDASKTVIGPPRHARMERGS